MKYNIFFIMLLVTTVAQGKCFKFEGKYSTDGIGEQITLINLLKGNVFNLKHEVWVMGAYENRKITSTKGSWSCDKGKIVLTASKRIYNAEFISIAENPYGINEKTQVLHIKPNSKNDHDYLGNKILYPVSVLKNIKIEASGY